MPFHSPEFLLLCALTLALYYLGRERWQQGLLLVSSLAFYYYAGLTDTILLLSAVGVNYFAGFLVAAGGARARRGLVAVVVANLGLLAYFKYRRLIVDGVNHAFGLAIPLPDLVIPLGISFYLFQLIAYQVDLSRNRLPPERSFKRMLLYILFFPHHQAGPIMRPAAFLPQFHGTKSFDRVEVARGGLWILWGLVKKVTADNLAMLVDPGFAGGAAPGGAGRAWLIAIAYAAQIYGDFSGYSDIAVGLGKLFGYQLDRNFDQPYLATSPAELWKRWHITLSAWLRDYLYIPLGGNRGSVTRTHVNLMLTMLLGGLWHGASLMFVLWGAIHGALLVGQRLVPALFRVPVIGWLITLGATIVAWVPFRSPTWHGSVDMLATMAGRHGLGSGRDAALAAGLFLALVTEQWLENRLLHGDDRRRRAEARWHGLPAPVRGAVVAAAILGVVLLLADHSTYIYFRF